MANYKQEPHAPDPIPGFDPVSVMTQWDLTLQRVMFCEWYLLLMNPAKAGAKAGFAFPQVEGSRLLNDVKVRAYLDHRFGENKIRPNELLAKLAAIARADIADYLIVDPLVAELIDGAVRVSAEGRLLDGIWIDLKRALKDNNTSVIKAFKRIKGELVIELHDPVRAIELLGKHWRMWAADIADPSKGNNTADPIDDAELEQIIRDSDQAQPNDTNNDNI
jgi:hypothetical protein